MTLDLLISAQSVAAAEAEDGLPADRLRFSLQYPEPPEIAAERDRLAVLLGGDNFALEPLDALLPQFLVLQFPGVARRMSAQALYAAADALVDALDLVSAVPDVAASLVVAPAEPGMQEGLGEWFLNLTCWAEEDESLDPMWSVNAINAPAVWARGITGSGVRVAQPDTGVADHVELADALDLSRAFNTLNNTSDPTDPLSEAMGNPGHGTSTASAVASRQDRVVFGAAPGARVIPIRCLDRVVLGLDPTPVARAILHAVRVEADVVSMSLGGGLYSPSIAGALQVAVDAGLIIVSAAGNCVQQIVVYPARDRNAIAMAGTGPTDAPWKGTSRGQSVDMAAPAENVRVARRSPGDGDLQRTKPSQGTSYATALTAGVAALWVEHWGRDTIRTEATRLNVSVNHLFRFAMKHAARTPSQWPVGMGAGIVDAAALIDLDITAILPAGTPENSGPPPDGPVAEALETAFSEIELGMDDWPRIGAETVFLLNDAWMRENRSGGVPLESASRPAPSDGLRARMPDPVRSALATAETGRPVLQQPIPGAVPATREFAKLLAAGAPGTAESSAVMSNDAARARLEGAHGAAVVSRADAALEALSQRDLGDDEAKAIVMREAEHVIRAVSEDRIGDLDVTGLTALEALVQIVDRPAYRVVDTGSIDPQDPLFGEWGGFLHLMVDLPAWTRSVGRINLDGHHVGTGFLMGGNQVMTNRHVLEALVDEVSGPGGQQWRFDRGAVTIDFSETADGSQSVALDSVRLAGPDRIGGIEVLTNLDAAVLGVADGASGLPPALAFAPTLNDDSDIIVIGYPARPGTSAFIDPATGMPSQEIARRLRAIFGTEFGRKYVAPGRVTHVPGTLPGDSQSWVLGHDCTTLGGNSGSVVVQFGAAPAVAGLHFSGAPLIANKAHALGKVDKHSSGPITGAIWV